MKYTKYNYKKRRNNSILKFVASLLIGVVLASMTGLGVAWIIFKVLPLNDSIPTGNQDSNGIKSSDLTSGDSNNDGSDTVITGEKNTEFYFIQCGYFSEKDNADQALAKVQSEGGAFINEESGKYRVFAGAYTKESVDSELSELVSKGIDSVKVTFVLSENDKVEAQVSAICDGYLQILTTTFAEDVKSVKTQEFKDWVNTLDDVSGGNNLEILEGLKSYVINLPDEISKEDVAAEMDYLYNLLLTFK